MVEINISIDVPDLAEGVDFYTNALGCTKLRDQSPNMVVLEAENIKIYLLEKKPDTEPFTNSPTSRSYQRHWTPVHLDFLIADVEGAVANVVKFGGTREGGEKGEWGEIAFCADPFGNGFCVIQE